MYSNDMEELKQIEARVKALEADKIATTMSFNSDTNLYRSWQRTVQGNVNTGFGTSNPDINARLTLTSGAASTVPLSLEQDALTSANFKLVMKLGVVSIYVSDQTTPNGNLTATEGSICLNGSATGQAFWNNNGGTGWTALA